jgi:hypothetical protein
MRRLTLVVAAALGLVTASVAIGALSHARTTAGVTATFTATTAAARTTTTCTSADGTYQLTNGTYTGSSTGDPLLAGPIKLTVRAWINTTKRLGTIDGSVVVDRAGRDTRANLAAVYHDGSVSGVLTGAGLPPGQRLIGTFTASYSPDGGFGAGGIGVGNLSAAALELTRGDCVGAKPATGQLKLVGGRVSALTNGSITIALRAGGSFNCSLDDRARAQISRRHIRVGDHVSAFCVFRTGTWTLLHVAKLPAGKKK